MSPLFPCRFLRFNYPNSTTRVVGRQEGDTAVVDEGFRELERDGRDSRDSRDDRDKRNPDRPLLLSLMSLLSLESLSAGRASLGAGRVQSRGETASGEVWFRLGKGGGRAIRRAN